MFEITRFAGETRSRMRQRVAMRIARVKIAGLGNCAKSVSVSAGIASNTSLLDIIAS